MTEKAASPVLICQWCGASPPKGKVRWWDGRPECASAFACQRRAMAAPDNTDSPVLKGGE